LNDAATKITPNFSVFGTQRKQGWNEPTDEETLMAKKMKTYHRNIAMKLEWNKIQQK
jgi:hypothetical protein